METQINLELCVSSVIAYGCKIASSSLARTWQICSGCFALEAAIIQGGAAHFWQFQAKEWIASAVTNPEWFYADHAV
jgi:hypothetical protein